MKCARNAAHRYAGLSNHDGTIKPVIELVSPTSGQLFDSKPAEDGDKSGKTPKLTILDFHFDQATNRFTHCPAGHELHRAHYREYEDQHILLMLAGNLGPCKGCPQSPLCPMRRDWALHDLRINGKALRLAQRRDAEKTNEFKAAYRKRGGIEATNSMLKRVTGLGRLRVRGRPAVAMSSLLKVAGWNILRAASVRSLLAKLTQGGHAAQFRKLMCDFESPDRHQKPPKSNHTLAA